MSILIKGMEMPQAGDMIICGQINGKLQCTIVTRGKSTKWCEASEVSAPHGRLIDADRLMEVIEKNSYLLKGYYNSLENGMFLTGIKQAIDEAPTIIDVEVSE